MSIDQPGGLIRVLLDESLPYGDRDDAAIDLRGFDHSAVRDALAEVALRSTTHPDIAERCAESLAVIWCSLHSVDSEVLRKLRGSAAAIARAILESDCPDLLPEDSLVEPL
jgi:hypothetical protein